MFRSKKGRISPANTITLSLLPRIASRMSVATTAFMQIPAFFASCTPQAQVNPLHVRIGRTAHSQKTMDIFFFDAQAPFLLDSYQQVTVGDDCSYVMSGPGEKIVAALPAVAGDLYSRASVSRLYDLKKELFTLEEDSPEHPFTYGLAHVGAGASRDFVLNLEPLICSIRVRSVSCDFGGRIYGARYFHNDNLYLINASSESCPLAAEGGHPVSWLNYGFRSSELPYVFAEGVGDIGSERVYPGKSLYCYPNPGARPPTRLVLEGTVGDVHCYYPIDIPLPRGGLSYELDITLYRMGTDSPDCAAQPGTYLVEYSTVPWIKSEEREETY